MIRFDRVGSRPRGRFPNFLGAVAAAVLLVAASVRLSEPAGARTLATGVTVQVTEEGQHVVFDGFTWQRRELAKRLPLDQAWPSEDKMAEALSKYGLANSPVPDPIPVPAMILPGIYLVGSHPNHTYLIDCGPDGVAVIDPGLVDNFRAIIANIERLGYARNRIRWVLNTHAHFDHSMADGLFRKLGAKILIGEADADAVEEGTRATAYYLLPRAEQAKYPRTKVDWRLSDGAELHLGNNLIEVISTPGHTPGSSSFLIQIDGKNVLFSGDTVLYDYRLGQTTSYGNNRDYLDSLEKLAKFSLNIRVPVRWDVLLPGHGALVMDRAYMDIDKAWHSVEMDMLEGRPIAALPFGTPEYRTLMFGRP